MASRSGRSGLRVTLGESVDSAVRDLDWITSARAASTKGSTS
jgi:hypothetical protein